MMELSGGRISRKKAQEAQGSEAATKARIDKIMVGQNHGGGGEAGAGNFNRG
jgi:hypothetical protein